MYNKNSILTKITKMDHIQPKNYKYKSSFSTKTKIFTIQNQNIILPKSFCLSTNIPFIYLYLSISYSYDLPAYSDYVFIHTVVFRTTAKHCVISV